ncbi:hypothetical protein PR003_g29143 [Phytophthora rubi]|uniref:Elicitin-like protein n=1 Tax=Phytophthora rubi TaxID=129364 RepID=A0A6A4BK21_9STRA|nr:hypothetical protein PR001_g28137 [Phytophthora rubi]KAE9276144.1 hypothetical protein PR003_g29143 [Phytophthora rubi]
MKLLITGAMAVALVQSTSATSCAISTLSKLLTDQYIDQCSSDSGYVFTTGVQPSPEEVAGMCGSDACHNLLADVVAMNVTECTLPIGNKIYLFADLVDYVSDQCEDEDTPVPTTATPTAAPTPAPTTATPAPTTAIASCTSAQLKYLLTSTYEKQCIADTGYVFTAPYSPTDAQVVAMCASESCVNLFAYVDSMVAIDCRIPVGGKILLLADLVNYVANQCSASTTTPSTTATATETPPTPASTTEAPTTPAPTTATPVTSCATKTISSLLTDANIDQCASDSGYSFTSGVQPDSEEVAGMCASSACANLLADVEAMGLSECFLPIGDKIYLFRDLVDYVAGQCSASTTTPSTTAPATETPTNSASGFGSSSMESPSTQFPSTTPPPADSPATSLPGSDSPTTGSPSTNAPETESPSTSSSSSSTESPTTDTPTVNTPEPTSPTHDSC